MKRKSETFIFIILLIIFNWFTSFQCRKHHLTLHNDIRRYFPISTFGYFTGGSLEISIDSFKYHPQDLDENLITHQFGFSLARTLSNNISPYVDGQYSQHICTLNQDVNYFNDDLGVVFLKLNIKNNSVSLECNDQLNKLPIFSSSEHTMIVKRDTERKLSKNPDENVPKSDDLNKNNNKEEGKPDLLSANDNNANLKIDPKAIESEAGAQPAPVVENKNNNNGGDDGELNQENSQNLGKKNQNSANSNNNDDDGIGGQADVMVDNIVEEPKKLQSSPEEQQQQQQQPQSNQNHQNSKTIDSNLIGIVNFNDNNKNEKQIDNNNDKISTTVQHNSCFRNSIAIIRKGVSANGSLEFSFKFKVFISEQQYEGLYALHFHNCLNYPKNIQLLDQYTTIDLDMHIVEKNLDNYLSAGEEPLPQLFFSLSIIFFILGSIWFVSIRNRYEETFKIHYLMGVLVFVKALSLLFHSINYYFIAKEGSQVETWAVLYYITHFLKGALLFITIVLIGTGWAFIKHILNDKDKKIFMIVIPLQVIANIADIITEESEEGALIHTVWREIFILVDMICCGAILFPVIWSIRHLQEASATDGKAAINLKKLQLFRFFYVMIVFYIYFTRVIVYLVKITVPFNYEWLESFFQHIATLIFFLLTGYHFQPTSTNPYYQLLQDDIEMDEEVLFIQPSTFTEAKKRNRDLESGDLQNLLNNPHDYE